MENPVLNLKYTTYPDRIASGLFHYKADGPFATEGFGSDFVESKALVKAATECVERHCLYSVAKNAPTSNGFAGHSSSRQARRRAYLELVERDAFLLGWLSARSPNWIKPRAVNMSPECQRILAQFKRHCFQVQLGLVARLENAVVVVGALRPGDGCKAKFGVVFGCACKESLEEALLSVLIELARASTVILNRTHRFKTPFENMSVEAIKDGRSTFEYYLNPNNFGAVESYLSDLSAEMELPPFQVEYEDFHFGVSGPALNLVISRAKSSEVQQLFFGVPHLENINYARFQSLGLSPSNFGVMPLP